MSSINQKPVNFPDQDETVIATVDKVIGDSLEEGSFEFAFNLISRYRSLNRVSDLGVAKTLHGVNQYWDKVEHEDGDTFFNWSGRATGYVTLTVERYLGVWEMLSGGYIPEQYQHSIYTHTIRQLFKVYPLVVTPRKQANKYTYIDQDYIIEDEDWLALSEANDERRVVEIVHRINGKERNKNFMSLKIDSKGDIIVYQNNEQFSVGFLNIGSQDLLVHKAIRRIMDGAGITVSEEK